MPSISLHVAAPPSAVVKFLTAWKLKFEKSAILPTGFPCHVAPNACAASVITITLPIASCNLFTGWNRDFLASTIENILS